MIDLHTHSTASDGTDTPAQLVELAAAVGITVVALTDHDTTAGWAEAADAAQQYQVSLVRGAELSTISGETSIHLLAYLFDPTFEPLAAELTRIRRSRFDRAEQMAARLAADYPITWESVLDQVEPGATVGRPHLADALVAAHVVANRDEAFESMLHRSSPYYIPNHSLDTADAIALVRAAGGVPVVAHPFARRRGRVVDDVLLADLAAAGLAGVEVDHREHDVATRTHLRGVAAELNLLVTGSSDYHGAGKPNRLGEHQTSPEVLKALVAESVLGAC